MLVTGPPDPAGNKLRTSVVTFENDDLESHDVNIIDNHHHHNITTKLLRIFRSKKWKKKVNSKNIETGQEKTLAFPKVRLRRPDQYDRTGEECEQGISNHHHQAQKSNLKISKSLPVRKPVIVWEEIQEFQNFLNGTPDQQDVVSNKDKISVSTQTDIRLAVLYIYI